MSTHHGEDAALIRQYVLAHLSIHIPRDGFHVVLVGGRLSLEDLSPNLTAPARRPRRILGFAHSTDLFAPPGPPKP